METLTIRFVDDDLHAALRLRAAARGRSIEAEVLAIVREVVQRPTSGPGMGTRIRHRFAEQRGGVTIPTRVDTPRAADLPD